MKNITARTEAIALVERALVLIDEAEFGGMAAPHLDQGLAYLRIEEAAVEAIRSAQSRPEAQEAS